MPFDPGEGDAYRREFLEREAAEAARAGEEAHRAGRAREVALLPRIERGDVEAMRAFIASVSARYAIAVEYRLQADLKAVGGWAVLGRTRKIVVPQIENDINFATCLHELGHCLSEPCRGGDHHRDSGPGKEAWWICIRCETLAWEKALSLAPFSREMFRDLRHCLDTYRSWTAAPTTANEAADRLKGTLTWATYLQQRKHRQWRLERQASVEATIARDRERVRRQENERLQREARLYRERYGLHTLDEQIQRQRLAVDAMRARRGTAH